MVKKPKVFYGYWILVAAFFCVFIYSGCVMYAFSLFVIPLQADFGWGRGEIMAAFTIYYVVAGVASPFIGRLIDRYGVRKVIFMGSLTAGLGFVLLNLVSNLWQFYIGYVIVGVGIAGAGFIPASTAISNWFKKRRGTAIGIMSIGVGVGGFTLAPLVGGYLIPSFGWRVAYLVLALFTWMLIPLALFVIKTKPADLGLYPDGIEPSETVAVPKASLAASEGLNLKMALGTSAFWLIAISFFLSSFSHIGVMQHQVPHLDDIGIPVTTAATALGTIGVASAIGKFSFGWLCDRMPAKYACGIGISFEAASIVVFMIVTPTSPLALLWLYATLMGFGAGSWLPTMSMLASTNFGLASYGVIFGMLALFNNLGVATGPLMVGYMYDIMHSYYWAFIICLVLYVIAIPAILIVRRPKSFEYEVNKAYS